jgi:AcrR family transcriptional regulator
MSPQMEPVSERHLSQSAPSDADPRVARTRANVLRAATDLLVDGGPSAVTIEAIVARSGVARSTLYRHWDSRDDILMAVIENCAPDIAVPDESVGFDDSLRQVVDEIRRMLTDPEWMRVLPAMLALRHQEHGVADLEARLEKKQEHVLDDVIDRGIAEGRLSSGLDREAAEAMLIGPLLFAVLIGKPVVDVPFCERVVDAFLDSYGVG